MLDSQNQAIIDLSQRQPDYFSCKNCEAYRRRDFDGLVYAPDSPHAAPGNKGFARLCFILQDRGVCAKRILANALASGAVQVVLHIEQPVALAPPAGVRVRDHYPVRVLELEEKI